MYKRKNASIVLTGVLIVGTVAGYSLVQSSFPLFDNSKVAAFEYKKPIDSVATIPHKDYGLPNILADIKASAQPVVVQAVETKVAEVEQEIPVNAFELQLVSKLLMEEGGNQSRVAKIAILNVLQNRMDTGAYISIEQMIYAKGQFSCVKKSIRNNPQLASRGNIYENFYDTQRAPNEECVELTKLFLQDKLERILPKDVRFYYNPSGTTDKWMLNRAPYKMIGDHMFAYPWDK
jgi:spore germination cell wall hydrolase CwlJ-like protein